MEHLKKNKELIIRYYNELSNSQKTRALLQKYISDESLIESILFFDGVFPRYEGFIEDMIAEGNRVLVRARLKGRHEGAWKGIPPTHRIVDYPFVICYEIEDGRIASHWLLADQLVVLEQLGVLHAVH